MTAPENACFAGETSFPDGNSHSIRFVHTPGHTTGSVCYYWDGMAFSGDILLFEKTGRTDLPGSSPAQLAGSITKLLGVLPDRTMLFPGHGRPWPLDLARAWWKKKQTNPNKYKEEKVRQ